MIAIGRFINGIVLNPLEYVLNEDGTVNTFEDKAVAQQFLLDNGILEEELGNFEYVTFEG